MQKITEIKTYPHFTPGNTPNRAQRRKNANINKRGLYQPGRVSDNLLIINNLKYRHFIQKVPIFKKGSLRKTPVGYRQIEQTMPV